jgi:hypothetical protein
VDEAGLVETGGDDELIDPSELSERSIVHRLGVFEAIRAPHDDRRVASELAHLGFYAVELGLRPRCEQHLTAERGQR